MAILARLILLLPLALSIVGIVLSSLCLFSGRDEGFMEDYAIARLNTSMIGQNVIPFDDNEEDSADTQDSDDSDGGFFDDIKDDVKDKFDDVKDDAQDKINDISNDIADRLADELGISDWYSIHIMSACEGEFEPNATDSSPSLNVTNCSESTPTYRMNLTEILNKQLEAGPMNINLADLNWPPEIQEKLDIINDLLLGLFIVYVLGMGFSGLAILGTVASMILASSRLLTLFNFVLSALAAISITAGSIIVTVAGVKGVDELNKVAEDFGVHAERGRNFLIISWVAAGCMIAAAVFWTTRFCMLCVERRREKRAVARKEGY